MKKLLFVMLLMAASTAIVNLAQAQLRAVANSALVRARLRGRYGYVSVAVLSEPKGLSSRVPENRLCVPAPMYGELPRLHQALPRRFSGLRYCLRARTRKPELGRRNGPRHHQQGKIEAVTRPGRLGCRHGLAA